MGSTAVRYMMQEMLSREYTLECTQQALVSDIVHFFLVQLCSYSNVKQNKYTCIPNALVFHSWLGRIY